MGKIITIYLQKTIDYEKTNNRYKSWVQQIMTVCNPKIQYISKHSMHPRFITQLTK